MRFGVGNYGQHRWVLSGHSNSKSPSGANRSRDDTFAAIGVQG
jgi:hypothetical protein